MLVFIIPLVVKILLHRYPIYLITTTEIISIDYIFFSIGKEQKQLELHQIEVLYIDRGPSILENWIFLFIRSIDELKNKYEIEEFTEGDFLEVPNDLELKNVQSPDEFLAALQNTIPLKPHPILKNTYEKI
ncbi:MAG: hypothetical protein ACTSQI_21535 [Candidatus Helarchaeota archaeon]